VKAIQDKVGTALHRDCYLNPDLCYDYYVADVKISLVAHDSGREAPVNVSVHDTQGEPSNPEEAALEASDAEFHVDAAPPNEVRVSTGQDVPMLTKDADGRQTIKGAKYSRKRLEKAAQ
jgi:hypothetical protein